MTQLPALIRKRALKPMFICNITFSCCFHHNLNVKINRKVQLFCHVQYCFFQTNETFVLTKAKLCDGIAIPSYKRQVAVLKK